ncbi:3' terminal RNA ribose 2'-O-methyltransferase Hen1 [Psychrobacillus sp. NEAU-3TGS]|nr:3' terminal RNA ribose 2'-O-methyltransferase Hen1 [Psychrobacillus sp. NEAU-3TGS]MDI2588381.1 3' terminal RNA ribose 2'-O-methyltransferase Hen1 [Psychrobacillus sp. NEAU-3TGS]
MQLTIRATGENVQVLSHLLAKNPSNLYERTHKDHAIRLFFSTFTDKQMEMTIFVTPDPLSLINQSSGAYDITHYINDREFAVSSIFTSLIRPALSTALNGKPKEAYEKWVEHSFSFHFSFGPVATELSEQEIRNLFEPLGYEVNIEFGETDYSFQIKEKSSACYITLSGMSTLQKGLHQLFVLIPVLDNYKHYFIDDTEIEKLKRYGEGWLDTHPEKEFIIRKALRFKELYDQFEKPEENLQPIRTKQLPLNELRYEKIVDKVSALPKKRKVVDFGSGEGKLSAKLGFVNGVEEILAVEPSESETLKAVKRFEKLKEQKDFTMPTMIWGSLFYFDERLKNKDVIILCEVIEHIDEERLPKIMALILAYYQPSALIVTTPNKEYNRVYAMSDEMRHSDHRFEWTRHAFREWCEQMNHSGQYEIAFEGIGEEDMQYGSPTQMCTFIRKENQL